MNPLPLLLIFLLLFSAVSSAEGIDVHSLRIGKGDWCPYVCDPSINEGKIGYAAELLESVFREKGYTVTFVPINYSRGIEQVRNGESIIMACMYSEDAPDLLFPQTPLGMSENGFFVVDDTSWRFTGISSLANMNIGLVHSYMYPEFQDFIESNQQQIHYVHGRSPLTKLFKMLQSKRIQTFFDDLNVVRYEASRTGISNIQLAGGFGLRNQVLVGFSPVDPRSKKLRKILENGIRKKMEDGTLLTILQKYSVKPWW